MPDKRILEKPELDPGLVLYWNAYSELSTCRPASFGDLMPIPWTVIREYCQFNEFSEEQEERLRYFIRKMDDVVREHQKKKNGSSKP